MRIGSRITKGRRICSSEEKSFVSKVILLAEIAHLASACGKKSNWISDNNLATSIPESPEENPSQARNSSNVTITTTTLLTGAAARQESGPVGVPQDEASLAANGILPWGPVQAVHEVDIDGTVYTVNQLSSPDPFTAEYQLENGNMYSTNMPLEKHLFYDSSVESPQPPTELWQCSTGDFWEIVPGRMTVEFDNSASEAEIATFIAAEDLHVVMSWFEALELSGGGEASSASSRSASQGAGGGGLSEGGGGTTENLLGGGGNVMAWFDFRYDAQRFATTDAAISFFEAVPKVFRVTPHIIDFAVQDYPVPNDEIYKANDGVPDDPYGRESRWADPFGVISNGGPNLFPIGPIPGPQPQPYIAVMDDGVFRGHRDMGRISHVALIVDDDVHPYEFNGGNPVYRTDKPGMETNKYYHRMQGHGTQIASLINGTPDNIFGVPSLAPGAVVLPIRLKQWTKYHGIPGVPTNKPYFSSNAPNKAVRGLRFKLKHEQWHFNVRVVNMSFSWPSYLRSIPDLDDPFAPTFKKNVSLDLSKNDRLYVASAGNEAGQRRAYPAAHSNVLGVSGLDYDANSDTYTYRLRTFPERNSSNFMPDDTYPVSGVYTMDDFETYTAVTHPLPGHWGYFDGVGNDWLYDHPKYTYYLPFGGTSAAAPQVSALAYYLYSWKPYINPVPQTDYEEVWDRIVDTRKSYLESGFSHPLKGPADFQTAMNGW